MSLHTLQSADKAGMKDYIDPREQPVTLTGHDADVRRQAKLDLFQMVEEAGVANTRALLPRLGMVERFGLATVTVWLNNLARDRGEA